jgi:hypothetical protein
MARELNVVARRPKYLDATAEWDRKVELVVVDRGEGTPHRFVSATIDPVSLAHGEWYWGHYFATLPEAMTHFFGGL